MVQNKNESKELIEICLPKALLEKVYEFQGTGLTELTPSLAQAAVDYQSQLEILFGPVFRFIKIGEKNGRWFMYNEILNNLTIEE